MKLTEEQLKELMQRQTAADRADCLTEDQFMRAAAGEMSQQERIGMAHHLTTCSHCVEEYRIIRSLKPWVEKAQTVAASDISTQATIIPIRRERESERQPARYGLAARRSPRNSAFALAASVLIILALGGWLLLNRQEQNNQIARLDEQLEERDRALASAQESLDRTRRELEEAIRSNEQKKANADNQQSEREEEISRLRQTVKEITRPQIDVPIIDLDPSPVRSGEREKSDRIEVPRTASFLTLILNFSGESYPQYEVEIFDNRGKRVWNGQRARKSDVRSLNLTLARSLIPNGQYLIKLYGLKSGSKELLASYAVTINYQ